MGFTVYSMFIQDMISSSELSKYIYVINVLYFTFFPYVLKMPSLSLTSVVLGFIPVWLVSGVLEWAQRVPFA